MAFTLALQGNHCVRGSRAVESLDSARLAQCIRSSEQRLPGSQDRGADVLDLEAIGVGRGNGNVAPIVFESAPLALPGVAEQQVALAAYRFERPMIRRETRGYLCDRSGWEAQHP